MRESMTKSQARNIFYGGSLAFLVIFVGLTVHSHIYIIETATDHAGLTESVARGKRIWERHACINCLSSATSGSATAAPTIPKEPATP